MSELKTPAPSCHSTSRSLAPSLMKHSFGDIAKVCSVTGENASWYYEMVRCIIQPNGFMSGNDPFECIFYTPDDLLQFLEEEGYTKSDFDRLWNMFNRIAKKREMRSRSINGSVQEQSPDTKNGRNDSQSSNGSSPQSDMHSPNEEKVQKLNVPVWLMGLSMAMSFICGRLSTCIR